MQTLPLKSTYTHYLIKIERSALDRGPAVLAENDRAVAVLLPVDDYQAFQRWRETQPTRPVTMPPEFASEVAAFERLKSALQEQYGGQVVAIYQGAVVAVGRDKMAVLGHVLDKYGSVPCYIEWVEPDSPRRTRVTSAWVRR